MIKGSVTHPGITHSPSYGRAIKHLQNLGFQTELWCLSESDVVTLRWVKKGSCWHVTSSIKGGLPATLEMMGINALGWIEARSSANASESNYAVRESISGEK